MSRAAVKNAMSSSVVASCSDAEGEQGRSRRRQSNRKIGARAPHTQPEPRLAVRTFRTRQKMPLAFTLSILWAEGYEIRVKSEGFCYFLFARVSTVTFTANHDNT